MASTNRATPWQQMTLEERVEHTAGQLDALFAFLHAIIQTHPQPENLAADFVTGRDFQFAGSLGQLTSDQYLAGQQQGHERLKSLLRGRGVTIPE